MVQKVLIANRGVAAVRIARTLNRLGIPFATVHSDADADVPHARHGESIPIGKPPARDSYLRADALIDAARRCGADAIHPGYGFLSENPGFARAVRAAGLTFIGPSPDHIDAMGDKATSRRRMDEVGVPVLPASAILADGADVAGAAEATGYPLLVKATAGGGGIGMQRASTPAEAAVAVQKARQLAGRAFGNGAVYLERWVEPARHVEFQMVGDGTGRVVALHERDCSVQRRHQKVIEESPAPFVDRAACTAMAERLARALGSWNYASLGTVEMLLDPDGAFWFLEMNTRLQVEHGVTEAVTGLDLVELQVRLAAGDGLAALLPSPPQPVGHAIEARIYAEDPVRFLPSPGRLGVFRPPSGPHLTVDAAFAEGNTVTPFYDPMLALVIAHGADRDEAIRRLDEALAGFAVEGVSTNIPFLRRMLASDAFRDGRHHTTMAEAFARSAA